jgi:hypothetical protein
MIKPPVLSIHPQKTAIPFAAWRFGVADEKGNSLFSQSGESQLPEKLEWDGRDFNGRMIDIGKKYVYTVQLADSSEKVLSSASQSVQFPHLAYSEQGVFIIQLSSVLLFKPPAGLRETAAHGVILHETCDLLLTHPVEKISIEVRSGEFEKARLQGEMIKKTLVSRLNLLASAITVRAVASAAGDLERITIQGPMLAQH